jgi:hypothetical protein
MGICGSHWWRALARYILFNKRKCLWLWELGRIVNKKTHPRLSAFGRGWVVVGRTADGRRGAVWERLPQAHHDFPTLAIWSVDF